MIQCIARADLIFHTDEALFTTAIAGRPRTILNFDGVNEYNSSIASGSFYNNTVSFNTALRITDGRDAFPIGTDTGTPSTVAGINTVSPTNFLGVSVANGEMISSSMTNRLTMTFLAPSNGIGLYVLSSEQLRVNEVALRVGASTLSINLADEVPLAGGGKTTGYAYFLGIYDSNPLTTFSSADLLLNEPVTGPIRIGIDRMIVAVPEPNSIALCALGLGAATLMRGWRRKRQSVTNDAA
jgi:hypothetical protein